MQDGQKEGRSRGGLPGVAKKNGEECLDWSQKKGRPWQVSLDTTTHNTILGMEGFPSSV